MEREPLDILTESVVWDNEVLVDDYMTGVYVDMFVLNKDASDRPDRGNDKGDASTWGTILDIDLYADEAAEGTGWGAITTRGAKFGRILIQGGHLEWYDNAYDLIRRLNILIEICVEIFGEQLLDIFQREFRMIFKQGKRLCALQMVKIGVQLEQKNRIFRR